jgi:hypothetical protein
MCHQVPHYTLWGDQGDLTSEEQGAGESGNSRGLRKPVMVGGHPILATITAPTGRDVGKTSGPVS